MACQNIHKLNIQPTLCDTHLTIDNLGALYLLVLAIANWCSWRAIPLKCNLVLTWKQMNFDNPQQSVLHDDTLAFQFTKWQVVEGTNFQPNLSRLGVIANSLKACGNKKRGFFFFFTHCTLLIHTLLECILEQMVLSQHVNKYNGLILLKFLLLLFLQRTLFYVLWPRIHVKYWGWFNPTLINEQTFYNFGVFPYLICTNVTTDWVVTTYLYWVVLILNCL